MLLKAAFVDISNRFALPVHVNVGVRETLLSISDGETSDGGETETALVLVDVSHEVKTNITEIYSTIDKYIL
jgi:hypothetical protein